MFRRRSPRRRFAVAFAEGAAALPRSPIPARFVPVVFHDSRSGPISSRSLGGPLTLSARRRGCLPARACAGRQKRAGNGSADSLPVCPRFLLPFPAWNTLSGLGCVNLVLTFPRHAGDRGLPFPPDNGDRGDFRFLPSLSCNRPRRPASGQVEPSARVRGKRAFEASRRSRQAGVRRLTPAVSLPKIRLAFYAISSPCRRAPIRTRFVFDLIAESQAGAARASPAPTAAPRQRRGVRYNGVR